MTKGSYPKSHTHRQALSVAKKKNWANPEYRQKMCEKFKIAHANKDYKSKMSEKMKSIWEDPEYKLKMSEKFKRRPPMSVSHKQAIGAAVKIRWTNQDYKKEQVELIKKRWEDPEFHQTMMKQIKPQTSMTPEKAYMLMALAGDGNLHDKNTIRITVKDKDFILAVKNTFETTYGLEMKIKGPYSRTVKSVDGKIFQVKCLYDAWCCSMNVVSDIQNLIFNETGWFVPEQIMNGNNEIKAAAISGFFDAEGSAVVSKGKNKNNMPCRVELSSTNKKSLLQIQKLLEDLGIVSPIFTYKNNKCKLGETSKLRISAENIYRFAEIITPRIERKRERLLNYKKWFVETNRNTNKNDFFAAKYLHECVNLGENVIGKILKIQSGKVFGWIYKNATPTNIEHTCPNITEEYTSWKNNPENIRSLINQYNNCNEYIPTNKYRLIKKLRADGLSGAKISKIVNMPKSYLNYLVRFNHPHPVPDAMLAIEEELNQRLI